MSGEAAAPSQTKAAAAAAAAAKGDDFFGDSDDDCSMSNHDIRANFSRLETQGFVESYASHEEVRLQEGFNRGYALGVPRGLEVGVRLGKLAMSTMVTDAANPSSQQAVTALTQKIKSFVKMLGEENEGEEEEVKNGHFLDEKVEEAHYEARISSSLSR